MSDVTTRPSLTLASFPFQISSFLSASSPGQRKSPSNCSSWDCHSLVGSFQTTTARLRVGSNVTSNLRNVVSTSGAPSYNTQRKFWRLLWVVHWQPTAEGLPTGVTLAPVFPFVLRGEEKTCLCQILWCRLLRPVTTTDLNEPGAAKDCH